MINKVFRYIVIPVFLGFLAFNKGNIVLYNKIGRVEGKMKQNKIHQKKDSLKATHYHHTPVTNRPPEMEFPNTDHKNHQKNQTQRKRTCNKQTEKKNKKNLITLNVNMREN